MQNEFIQSLKNQKIQKTGANAFQVKGGRKRKYMTEKEKKMICDLRNTEELDAIEIGELMQMATTCEGSDKLGNVLFDAITKSFALGYIRGSKKKQNSC